MHAVGKAWIHGRSAGEDDVGVEVAADVEVAFGDSCVGCFVDPGCFEAHEGGLEERLGGAEAASCEYLFDRSVWRKTVDDK